jgi:hypothetical protein
MRATCLVHHIHLDLIILLIFCDYKINYEGTPPTSCHFIFLRSEYSPSHDILKYPQYVFYS